MKLPIYLDHHSTTPVDPQVLEAMLPYFSEKFGNAASRSHRFGWEAEAAVEKARGQVADLLGAQPNEIIFTSGTTESDNLALFGVLEAYPEKGDHIVTSVTEHKAVLDTCRFLEKKGLRVTYLSVDSVGRVSPDDVKKAITDKTVLVSLMAAQNEIGTLVPLAEIGRVTRENGVLFHTDAAQAAGKIPLDVEAMKIDLLSLSAHKVYGPKGTGVLYVRGKNPRVKLIPMIHGGGHERGLRSGTLNVPAIVGMGKALEIAGETMEEEGARLKRLRDRLKEGLFNALEDLSLNGPPSGRLPHNLNVSFAYVSADQLMMEAKDLILSSGSACSSGSNEPSYVLKALGVPQELARGSIRFGLGRFNTEEEIDYALGRVVEAVNKIRAKSPLYEMSKAKG